MANHLVKSSVLSFALVLALGLPNALSLANAASVPTGPATPKQEYPGDSPNKAIDKSIVTGKKPASDPKSEGKKAAKKHEPTIKELLAELKVETDQTKAKLLEQQIQQKWADSGSATINLMMNWSVQAIVANDNGKALDILDYVTTLDPKYAEGWNRRAYVYFNMKNYGLALDDMRRALQVDPTRFDSLMGLATVFQSMERNKQALEIWYKVLEIYPANQNAQKAVIDLEEKISPRGI